MDNILEKQKVLIVDDEPANIRILIETLDGEYKLIGATSGAEAIECATSADPPDLILLDIIMSNMDGYEVCKRLKADKRTRDIPVIFITVMGEEINETKGFELGAVDYITKPINPVTVNARVQTHLELKRHRDRLERTLHERTRKLSTSTKRLREVSHERMLVEEERKRLITAIEQAAEVFIITEPDGTILYANPVFEKQTGYSREESLGKNMRILKSREHEEGREEDETDLYRKIWETVRHGNTWRGMFTNKQKDGSLYKAETAISPIFDNAGRVVNLVCVLRDVTREVELEAQLRRAQKLEAIGTLAGGIAHDFNNIICAIMGYSELAMINIPPDSQVFQYLERIDEAGRRAADLVRQILAFGRKGEKERQPMRMQPVVREVLKLLRGTLPSTIEFRQHIDATCRSVLASPTKIHQVIMNLCTNSYHAMRDYGGAEKLQEKPLLEISLTEADIDPDQAARHLELASGQYVRLRVSDNGHGMDEATLSKIFDPYFTTKKVGEGTGLGLSTVYGIVQEYGGIIDVHSKPGQGTRFDIFFPVYLPEDIPSDSRDVLKSPSAVPAEDKQCILVVDDEEPIARMIEMKLEHSGYNVMAYTGSAQALKVFSDSPDTFDLVISDMTMPDLTGIQLAAEMFRIRPDIPIVLCTGFSEIITEEQAKAMGIREYLRKPFIDGELEKTVYRVLKGVQK